MLKGWKRVFSSLHYLRKGQEATCARVRSVLIGARFIGVIIIFMCYKTVDLYCLYRFAKSSADCSVCYLPLMPSYVLLSIKGLQISIYQFNYFVQLNDIEKRMEGFSSVSSNDRVTAVAAANVGEAVKSNNWKTSDVVSRLHNIECLLHQVASDVTSVRSDRRVTGNRPISHRPKYFHS